jgi:hypothetical protein
MFANLLQGADLQLRAAKRRPSMPSTRTRILFFLLPAAILVSLLFSRPASAQCEPSPLGLQGFQNIAVEPGNPFEAKYSTNGLPIGMALSQASRVRSVARDSQGRVRVDHSAGNYRTKSPDGEQNEVERHIISICDPVSQNSIRLDTVDKTATLQAPRPRSHRLPARPALSGAGNDAQQSFCTRLFASRKAMRNARTEDLGHQLISGLDTVGLRDWHVPLALAGAEAKPPSSYTDMWCSDDLGAVVQQTFVAAALAGTHKSETTMQNMERREPDPQLFQIPHDYAIVERATEANHTPLLRALPAPSTPSARP